MSGHGDRWRCQPWDLLRLGGKQPTAIERKNGWRDKRDATCQVSCGCKSGRFSGGTGFGSVARFYDYRVTSIYWRVATRIPGLQ